MIHATVHQEDYLKRFFKNPHTLEQKRQGPLGPYIDHFAQLLSAQGFAQQWARWRLRLIAQFSHWLWRRHLTVRDITVTKMKRFLRSRARPQPIGPGSAACLKAFFELLAREGVLAAPPTIEKAGMDKLLGDFSLYLQQERLLAPGTIANYLLITKQFLTHRFKNGGINLAKLTAAQVVESVQHLASSTSRKRAKVMTSALRAFLRYAQYQSLIPSNLAASVPSVADWSVASLPQGLPIKCVERVLARCNRKSVIGRVTTQSCCCWHALVSEPGRYVRSSWRISIGKPAVSPYEAKVTTVPNSHCPRMSGKRSLFISRMHDHIHYIASCS